MNHELIRQQIEALRYDLRMFQRWLNGKGARLVEDGLAGPASWIHGRWHR